MSNHGNQLQITLPNWLVEYSNGYKPTTDSKLQMQFVIDAAARNIAEQCGGPFAAGVFEIATGRLIALGVNLVTSQGLSILHAEILALSYAQRHFGHFNLSDKSLPPCQLVTSSEPCAMCFGAIPWSGIRKVICGAKAQDARGIGFDEGAIPADWRNILHTRQITTETGVLAEAARKVLADYATSGGLIYNSCPGANDNT